MSEVSDERYATDRAFRAALEDRIKATASNGKSTAMQVRRQYAHSVFLSRVFSSPQKDWLLKGGAGLLMRIAGARHSRDLDLARMVPGGDLDDAFEELHRIAAGRHPRDRFTITLTRGADVGGGDGGTTLDVELTLDGRVFDRFPIDMVGHQDLIGSIQIRAMRVPFTLPGEAAAPAVHLYPLEDQVADKVLAMYDGYGKNQRTSSRFRDLVDILLITTAPSQSGLDHDVLTAALRKGARARGTILPSRFMPRGDNWRDGYAKEAEKSSLPAHLHDLETALNETQNCLGGPLAAAHHSASRPGA